MRKIFQFEKLPCSSRHNRSSTLCVYIALKRKEMMSRLVLLLSLLLVSLSIKVAAFQIHTRSTPQQTPSYRQSVKTTTTTTTTLASSQQSPDSDTNDLEDEKLRKQRLEQLGFSSPVAPSSQRQEPIKVRVDLIKNVDPVTLTAVGFTLLAINFLVLANMGDVGLAGIVARIINMSQ